MLGIPVIPVSARKRTGLDILMHAVAHHKDKHSDLNFEHHHKKHRHHRNSRRHELHEEHSIVYSDKIEDEIDRVSNALYNKYGKINNMRWHAMKLLEMDPQIMAKYPIDKKLIENSYEEEIINQKYDFIEEILEEVLVNRSERSASTDRIDRILTNRYFGLPIFLSIMALVFFLTFTVGDMIKAVFEGGLEVFSIGVSNYLDSMNVGIVLSSLIVDGIIAGVGGILTFLPNIFILFLALAYLEDSGYMSRVAYVMDGIMGKVGFWRAFIPMLLGFVAQFLLLWPPRS